MGLKKDRPNSILFLALICCDKFTIVNKIVGYDGSYLFHQGRYVCPYCLKSGLCPGAYIQANSALEAKELWKDQRRPSNDPEIDLPFNYFE